MIGNEVKFTSLCRVTEPYNDNKFNLYRIADIEKGCLCKPMKSNRATNYFENRDWIYKKDGPSATGSIGVWEWESIPNQNNPSSDYVQSYHVSNLTPVRVVITSASNLEDLIKQLDNGTVRVFPYFCDTLFGYLTSDGLLIGILCKTTEFQIIDHFVKINDDIYAFPYYSFTKDDIFYSEDINLCLLKNLQIGDPIDYIAIGNTDDIIKTLVLERSTWSLFKECIGATKAEWRHSKMLLEKICSDSLYDVLSRKLKCSLERAQQLIEDFSYRANELIETGDIDIETMARIAMRHDGLRIQCEESIFQKWKESHESEIAKATNELTLLQNEALQQQSLAQQQLLDIQNEISLAITEKENLLSEISKAEDKLAKLVANIEEYDTLGRETFAAVQKRIADARTDMAGFIAEISPFLQQPISQPPSNNFYSSWTYTDSSDQLYSNEELELAANWQDDLDSISQNLSLSLGVNPSLSIMFGAFLYAACLNRIPLLIVGPGGSDIANILSTSIYAAQAGVLSLGEGDIDKMEISVKQSSAQIISVQNMFGKGWLDKLPQLIVSEEKHIVWTHPYVEDFIIEPKGLFNYMIPVFSECFTECLPARKIFPGKHDKSFKSFSPNKVRPLHLKAFRQLGLSKIQFTRLEKLLSNAKEILNTPNSEKDLEILFGLLPFSILFGKKDLLKDTIENEKGISEIVKAEVVRYIGEE